MKKQCRECSEDRRCKDSFASWIFFIVGLVATIAMRVVTVLMHIDPIYGKIAWYIGIGGFLFFFIYKFKISQARAKLINQHDLVHKITSKSELSEDDYTLMSSLLCALSSQKERINYFVIFGLSAIALVVAVYIDVK